MAEKGAPIGNQNAAKGKVFLDALRKQLVQNPEKLDNIAKRLIKAAEDGEPWAIDQLANRTDGKPHQTAEVELSGNLSQALAAVSKE